MIVVAIAYGLPQQQNVGDSYTSHQVTDGESQPFWVRTFTDPIAFFTLVLAASTIGLWIVTWRSGVTQGRDTRKSLAIASRGADVAERTLVDAERPYVFIFGVVKFTYVDDYEIGESAYVEYTVANYGRTPAIIEEARACFLVPTVGDVDLVTTIDEDNPLFTSPIIGPGEKRTPIKHYRERVTDVDNPDGLYELKFSKHEGRDEEFEITPVLTDKQSLYFRVIIKYRRPFTQGHETIACWRYWEPFGYFDLDERKTTNYEK
jgi:hypothetical protein